MYRNVKALIGWVSASVSFAQILSSNSPKFKQRLACRVSEWVFISYLVCQSKNASRNWNESSSHHRGWCVQCNAFQWNLHTKIVLPARTFEQNKMRPTNLNTSSHTHTDATTTTQLKQTELPSNGTIKWKFIIIFSWYSGIQLFDCLNTTKKTPNEKRLRWTNKEPNEVSWDHWLRDSFLLLLVSISFFIIERWLDTWHLHHAIHKCIENSTDTNCMKLTIVLLVSWCWNKHLQMQIVHCNENNKKMIRSLFICHSFCICSFYIRFLSHVSSYLIIFDFTYFTHFLSFLYAHLHSCAVNVQLLSSVSRFKPITVGICCTIW